MRWLRLRLRTFLIVAAVLPAAFGMLWRCGQLDYQLEIGSEGWTRRTVRLFSVEASYDWQWHEIAINKVCGWYHVGPDGYYDASSPPVIARHPWDSRDWESGCISPLLEIRWGNPVAVVPSPPMPLGASVLVLVNGDEVPIPPPP